MALFSIPGIQISAISAAVPAHEVRNYDLEVLSGANNEGFARSVGINSRRVASPTLCASDLCIAAATAIIDRLEVSAGRIGALVFVTQTPDYLVPGNSMLAQHRLGLAQSTYLLDLHQGCAGYVYGLASLASVMSATGIDRGLLLVGDTITRCLSPKDRSTLPIFSDAGSATLLERASDDRVMSFNLGSDGRGANVIRIKGGGARMPFAAESLTLAEEEGGIERAPIHLAMRGIDVLHYVIKYVEPNIRELLAFAKSDVQTPDYYVFHQANQVLNASLVRRLGISIDRVPDTLFDYGNTSCATIPLTICTRLGAALGRDPTTLLLSGFGAGFSWGSALFSSESVVCPDLLELDESHAL